MGTHTKTNEGNSDREIPKLSGPRHALDEQFSATYQELRRLANAVKRNDLSMTLSPTALVNEAWIKLASSPAAATTSELHFKRIAARAMRQVLIDFARRRGSLKRGGGSAVSFSVLEELGVQPAARWDEFLELEDALRELERVQPRLAILVECRFFGGLSASETAQELELSESTINREWRAAKAWLKHQLRKAEK